MVRRWLLFRSVFCLFISLPMLAATHVWTGAADGRFSNPSNWIGGSPAGDGSAAISFPRASRQTATNDLNELTAQSIAFSGNGFSISGNPITLGANATVIDTSAGTNTIGCDLELAGHVAVVVTGTVYDRNGLVLSGVLSGSGEVTLRGGGHLVYAGSRANTYSGTTRVLYGELQLKKNPNITAIAGDLDIEDDGFNYEHGYLSIFNDEQIANSSHVTLGTLATFGCGATETLGALTLGRGATLQTAVSWSGFIELTGTVILAGDIEIVGTSPNDIHSYGRFQLQGMRTVKATANPRGWHVSGPGQKTPGSGVVITGGTYSDGTFSDVLAFSNATYDGSTTLKGGSVRIDAPRSAVDLQNGRYSGHCKSLTAEGGELNLHRYLGGVTSDGDVKLSPSVTVDHEVGTAMKMSGALDLGGATLMVDDAQEINYGAVYTVIDNASTYPVKGMFANLPEGSTIRDRYRISYVGGDGNDVTLTDIGLVPSYVSLTVSPPNPKSGTSFDVTATVTAPRQLVTGTVTFSAGATVLGAAPVSGGYAQLTAGATLPHGQYVLTAAYSGDSRVAPGSATAYLYVSTPKPTLSSIDPLTITAGVKTTLTVHGTNFVEGSRITFSSIEVPTTFVSPTELRCDYTAYLSESDYQLDVWVTQPDFYDTQQQPERLKLSVTGVKRPASPFTFRSDLSTSVSGVTPGAMTLWLLIAQRANNLYETASIVTDTDRDGSVTFRFPFNVTALPPSGIWLVSDLSAHTIVSDNPSHGAPAASAFPPKAFLRDSHGNYTHVQAVASSNSASMFGWARAGAGAWIMMTADGGSRDDDHGVNGRVTFDTSAMQTVGSSGPPPAEGIRNGDVFMFIDGLARAWWGDSVDGHLPESDGSGKLGFVVSSTSARENAGTATIYLERTGGTDGTVSVQYATADDTAIAGKNYVGNSGTATFGPGEISKAITIRLIDDASYGGVRQFQLNLTNPIGASTGTFTTHTVRVDEDELPPVMSLQAPTTVQEGDIGQVDIPITVRLAGATSLPATVGWFYSEGQYGASHTGQLQFAPGETQKSFTVSFAANTIPEPYRTVRVGLGNPINATVSPDSTATVMISDDDFAGVSIADASVVESAGAVSIPLNLSRASLKPISITYETRNLTAMAGTDYVAKNSTMIVSNGSSITIPILDDHVSETTKVFEVVLTSVNGGKLDRSLGAITIVDDEPSQNATGIPALSLPLLVVLSLAVALVALRRMS